MNDQQRAVMQMALEALKVAANGDDYWSYDEAIAALKEALAQPDHIANAGKVIEQGHSEQEPVAVISESAIGLVKLHSNGVSLPFGTQLYAAPVERQWVDLTDDEMWDVFISKDWTGEPLQLMSAVIAAFKEKNK